MKTESALGKKTGKSKNMTKGRNKSEEREERKNKKKQTGYSLSVFYFRDLIYSQKIPELNNSDS